MTSTAASIHQQEQIDAKNSEFWNELCGTGLAKSLGITDFSEHSLKLFDIWFFDYYPYLTKYLEAIPAKGKVLEIGLGYGTTSTFLARRADEYYGLDIAAGPVSLVNMRLSQLEKEQTALVGSAHAIPFPDSTFDSLVSIGCFHHTGSIKKCIDEAYRVLKPAGSLLFMCYNRRSIRMLTRFPSDVFFKFGDPIRLTETGTALYDANSDLVAAPFIELGTASYYKKLCYQFTDVKCQLENWEGEQRDQRLCTFAKYLGLDVYVTCKKMMG